MFDLIGSIDGLLAFEFFSYSPIDLIFESSIFLNLSILFDFPLSIITTITIDVIAIIAINIIYIIIPYCKF